MQDEDKSKKLLITELQKWRKRIAEKEEMQISEEQLRLFIEHAPASLAMFDRDMRYLSFSRRWLSDYNLGDRDLRGHCHYDIFPEIPETWKDFHRRGLAGEVVRADSDRLQRTDGTVQWLRWEIRPWRDAAGDVAGIIILSEDITDHKQIHKALRESEELFRVMANSIPQLAWIARADGHIYWYNQRWYDYTGTTPEQMEEWGWQSVHDPAGLPVVVERWKEAIAAGKAFEMLFPLRGADGNFRHFLTRVEPVKNADGHLVQWCGTNTDITERKKIEDDLRQSESRFKLLSETASNLLASENPQGIVNELCRNVMAHLDCQVFFNFLVDADAGKLHLNACAGIPEEEARKIEWLDFGASVCACVARDGECLVAEDIFHTPDIRTDLVRSYGIQAYACHPLKVRDRIIGTLSFGTKTKSGFSPRELAVMKTVADQVAVAMDRIRLIEGLSKARNELEVHVEERTKALAQANEELREKAEIIDLTDDAIFVRDAEGKIIFWSRGAQEIYGFSCEQALGRISSELLQTVFPVPAQDIEKTVREKGEWKGELRDTNSNGKQIVVDSRWAIHTDKGAGKPGYLVANRDITARKMAEEKFRKADRAFRTLSECNQAMVRQTEEMELFQQVCRILVDVGGYRMAWVGFAEDDENKTVLPMALSGLDHGYLDGAKISWADTEMGRGPTGTAIRTGKTIISQNALLNPAYAPWREEGNKRGYAASISLPLIVEREIIGALTIYAAEPDAFDAEEASLLSNLAENLTHGIASIRIAEQRRRSERELRIYASRLEGINRELQEFAFVASHDLQEPLRKIQTFCDMAMQRCAPALDSAGKEYLDRVLKSATRMRRLLHDLLAFSRVTTRPEPFLKLELGKVVREAADVFEAALKETGCRIEIEDLPVIEADESQILQLFQNLIGNALKYRNSTRPNIKVYGRVVGQACEIRVEDNGIGFDPQFADRIFKPFQRLHGRSQYDGTGMGLAICRKIVERHDGTIRAESEPGKGSTFIVHLPAKQTISEKSVQY